MNALMQDQDQEQTLIHAIILINWIAGVEDE